MTNSPKNNTQLFVFHRSYFCSKMIAYMRYKEIPHSLVYKSLAEIGDTLIENTGLRVLPAIRLADGRWMSDTTPMINWFEGEFDRFSVLPKHRVANFIARLLEDYADEWLWRPAINSRWENKYDRTYYETLFPKEFAGFRGIRFWLAKRLTNKHMHREFLEGDGITEENREHVWSIYRDTLSRLDAIFQNQPFILGGKPSLADYGFFGSMFWHFGSDPTPSRIMHEEAPAVFEWVGRMWNAKGSRYSNKSFNINEDGMPALCKHLLRDVGESYLPYLLKNAQEYSHGNTRFNHHVCNYEYPGMRVSPYRVWCLESLQREFEDLAENEKEIVLNALGGNHATATLRAEFKPSNYDPEGYAPFSRPKPVSGLKKLNFYLLGSSYTTRRKAWERLE